MYKEISSDRLKEDSKKAFILPKSIFVILFLFLMAILGWQQIIKNNCMEENASRRRRMLKNLILQTN